MAFLQDLVEMSGQSRTVLRFIDVRLYMVFVVVQAIMHMSCVSCSTCLSHVAISGHSPSPNKGKSASLMQWRPASLFSKCRRVVEEQGHVLLPDFSQRLSV